MKRVIGTEHRWESRRVRKFQKIECQECGAITYERRSGRVQRALEKPCRSCERIHQREVRENPDPWENLDRDCGLALLRSIQWAQRLHHWLDPDRRWKHGLYLTPEYKAWHNMISRCYNPEYDHYADYGGRGIKVADEWREDPWMFLLHVGPRPSNDHSLDRVDNDWDYLPENVRWATQAEQNANRRDPIQMNLPWWRVNFGLYVSPMVYGPMPWKRTSYKFRREEAIERGWVPYVPESPLINVKEVGDTRNARIVPKPIQIQENDETKNQVLQRTEDSEGI